MRAFYSQVYASAWRLLSLNYGKKSFVSGNSREAHSLILVVVIFVVGMALIFLAVVTPTARTKVLVAAIAFGAVIAARVVGPAVIIVIVLDLMLDLDGVTRGQRKDERQPSQRCERRFE